MRRCLLVLVTITVIVLLPTFCSAQKADEVREYRVLATNKTSTMEKEMNEAAAAGFRFDAIMGGETSFGGSEAVTLMWKVKGAGSGDRFQYKLLATSRTSTMQKEMQAAGDAGYGYKGQTVYKSTFGGQEVVVIMEQDREAKGVRYAYQLLATKKTSTMQKEIQQSADEGYVFVGVTVAKTVMAGTEMVTIMQKAVK